MIYSHFLRTLSDDQRLYGSSESVALPLTVPSAGSGFVVNAVVASGQPFEVGEEQRNLADSGPFPGANHFRAEQILENLDYPVPYLVKFLNNRPEPIRPVRTNS